MGIPDISGIILLKGAHASRDEGMCVMEAAAWLAGRLHSDKPPCVSLVIGAFLRTWNDSMDDTDRQQLKVLLPGILGTATTDSDDETRAWMAMDWLVREYAPAWLRLAGLNEYATHLESLAQLVTGDVVRAEDAKKASSAAYDAAYSAASSAARSAASAARSAASSAASDAAYSASSAGRYAAYDAAYSAAYSAARSAASSAAYSAAREALRSTEKVLQASAVRLVQRMAAVGRS